MRVFQKTPRSLTTWHDNHDGTVTLQQATDVEPVVEEAKARHNEGLHTTRRGQKHVASIPVVVLQAWCAKQGLNYADAMQDQGVLKRFLEDPDNRHFRIWKGVL